jgi:hypothetical protein
LGRIGIGIAIGLGWAIEVRVGEVDGLTLTLPYL